MHVCLGDCWQNVADKSLWGSPCQCPLLGSASDIVAFSHVTLASVLSPHHKLEMEFRAEGEKDREGGRAAAAPDWRRAGSQAGRGTKLCPHRNGRYQVREELFLEFELGWVYKISPSGARGRGLPCTNIGEPTLGIYRSPWNDLRPTVTSRIWEIWHNFVSC